MTGDWRRGTAFVLSVCLVWVTPFGVAQDVKTGRTDPEETHDYYTPELSEITREERARAIRALKRVEGRSKAFGIVLNRQKMEKLTSDRLVKVLKEYDRFVGILDELPKGFVKACNIGTVWFSDEIVDASGQHAGGFASGAGINLAVGFSRGTVYHEMFHKFECCITDSQRKEWKELNPREFVYEGAVWDVFAGNDSQSKREAERHLERIKAGKEKSVGELREQARKKEISLRIAANKTNETVQAAFINGYAQTTPGEDRAEVFRCMMEEGPFFFARAKRSEHMRRKMEFMMQLTGKRRYLGDRFWEEHSDVSTGGCADGDARPGANDMPVVDPAVMGFDAQKLVALGRNIDKHDIATASLVVAVGGKVIYEYGNTSRRGSLSSCWPSLLSILYGKFVHMRRIDLDETLESLGITDNVPLGGRERSAKVRDLIASRSACYVASANDPPEIKHPERMSRLPGKSFHYNNWDFNVAAYILEKKTDANVFAAFDEMVARPLRLQDWTVKGQRLVGDTSRSKYLACDFHLSARDLARVGQMMLNKGKWRGMRVVPSSWIAKSTSAVSKFAGGGGFGYMWWVEDDRQIPAAYRGAFSARGQEGQYLTVMPALDMVVAHLPKSGKRPMTRDDYEKILMTVFLAKNDPMLTESVLKHLSGRQRLRAPMAKTPPNE